MTGSCYVRRFFTTSTYNNSPSNLNPLLKDILVGCLLGDGWLDKQKLNARFRFEQSNKRKEFSFHLYGYLSAYCRSSPKLRERLDKRTNKVYYTWHFSTRSLPIFTDMYNLFYKDKKK